MDAVSRGSVKLSDEVAEALAEGKPVVALESSILAHGMPHPFNVDTALEAERSVRAAGAAPATIAVIDGAVEVGLDRGQITAIGTETGISKIGRAELPTVVASGATGATTVSATMVCAQLAGISVFATGGIGGVHTNISQSLDISQDLMALAQISMVVVSSGAKAILDIPKTLEMLEFLSVTVAAVGQDEFPAFWSRSSGLRAPSRLDGPEQVARAFAMRRRLGITGGLLAANPIPANAEIPATRMRPWIEDATSDAERLGISGKAVTPFLLNSVANRSQSESVHANMALVCRNAALAGEIAVCLNEEET